MNASFPAASTGTRSASSNRSRSSSSSGSFYSAIMESLWSAISSVVVVVGEGDAGDGHRHGNSSSSEVLVHLPYIGPTPLPIVLFVGSALLLRISQFWGQPTTRPKSSPSPKKSSPRSNRGAGSAKKPLTAATVDKPCPSPRTHVVADSKAKTYKVSASTNQNQQALNHFMEKARSCKRRLRRVDDPEKARKAKICQIRQQHRAAIAPGPLQLSETKLLDKLASLKKTTSTCKHKMTGKDTQNVVGAAVNN